MMGHFYSTDVFVIQYIYQKQSSLYTWMEGMVFVWIGSAVKSDREAIVKEVTKKKGSDGLIPNMVCIARH